MAVRCLRPPRACWTVDMRVCVDMLCGFLQTWHCALCLNSSPLVLFVQKCCGSIWLNVANLREVRLQRPLQREFATLPNNPYFFRLFLIVLSWCCDQGLVCLLVWFVFCHCCGFYFLSCLFFSVPVFLCTTNHSPSAQSPSVRPCSSVVPRPLSPAPHFIQHSCSSSPRPP